MHEDGDNGRREAWTRYWSSGRLHSCVGSYAGNYDGAIGAFWRTLGAGLPAGARVLDLATGNGPLPLLLWELRGDAIEVDAVDLAALSPAWHQPGTHRTVRFHQGVRMEALPFAAAGFDCVASQFGFEYSDRPRALAECLRVSRPTATLALVMHHAGSVLVRVGREELAHHARLLGDDGLLRAALEVIPWIAQARSGAPIQDVASANAARERYNQAMRALADAAGSSPVPDLLHESASAVQRLLAGVRPENARQAGEALRGYAGELEGARLRTAEMVAHALERAQVEEMAAQVRAARPDAQVRIDELRQAEGVLAWSFVATPTGAG